MKKGLIYLFMALFSIFSVNAQEDTLEYEPQFYWGFYGGLNINQHLSQFQSLDGYPSCCPEFDDGTGLGFAFGGLFEYPLNRAVSLEMRVGYAKLDGDIVFNREDIGNHEVIGPGGNQIVRQVYVDHTINAYIDQLSFEPTINFRFFGKFYMNAGFRLGYLLNSRMDIYEEIVEPQDVTFLDGDVARNDFYDVEIPASEQIQFYGAFGAGYTFELSRTVLLMPELRYFLPFTDLTTKTWKVASFQIGAALKFPVYQEVPPKEIEETIYKRDTSVVPSFEVKEERIELLHSSEESVTEFEGETIVNKTIITEHYEKLIPSEAELSGILNIYGMTEDGKRQENPTLLIEEFETERSFPLLPYIYFPKGSSELDKSAMNLLKSNETSGFAEQSLPWNTLGIYEELLNIVAERLKQYPGANLTVTGCNNDLGKEKNNLQLSQDRAEAVKNYLVSVWDIEPGRIAIEKRNLPQNPGNSAIDEGIEENQRAELSSNNSKILNPVTLQQITEQANPPLVYITPNINSEAGLKSWQVNVRQDDEMIRSYDGDNFTRELEWQVEERPVPKLETPVNVELLMEDRLGSSNSVERDIEIKQITVRKKKIEQQQDMRIDRFDLIVFDYDKAEIPQSQTDIMRKIKSGIEPDSKVIIKGYADRTGDPEYNMELTSRRAQSVQDFLDVDRKNLELIPMGSKVELYNNDLPQGRAYSRTVRITVKTPIER